MRDNLQQGFVKLNFFKFYLNAFNNKKDAIIENKVYKVLDFFSFFKSFNVFYNWIFVRFVLRIIYNIL